MGGNCCKFSREKSVECGVENPFLMDGWIEFIKSRWGLDLFEKRYYTKSEGPPYLDVRLFVDQKGKISLPFWMPYSAIDFVPSATKHAFRIDRQWVELATTFASDMKKIGLAQPLPLPPDILDIRPWQWTGFKATVKYTYYLDLPLSFEKADRTVRANIDKALKAGYTCARSKEPSSILQCLAGTEKRSNFNYGLDEPTLELAQKLLGDDRFRMYVCHAPDGEPVSASVVICSPGGWAADWITGTKTEHLKVGAAQLLYYHRLTDLQQAGCIAMDMVGANMQSVAHMKATWGGRLVPYYVVEPNDLKTISIYLKQWVKYKFIP